MAKKKKDDGTDEAEAPEVATTAAAVTEAEAALADATAKHAEAVEAHRVASLPVPDPASHVLLEGVDGAHSLLDIPANEKTADGSPLRVTPLTIGGKTYHHVADHASGVWIYRQAA